MASAFEDPLAICTERIRELRQSRKIAVSEMDALEAERTAVIEAIKLCQFELQFKTEVVARRISELEAFESAIDEMSTSFESIMHMTEDLMHRSRKIGREDSSDDEGKDDAEELPETAGRR
uniref:Uncharacterized protein n=1 Tax=Florenciella parvula TaxID=236787 RepID=A0A7S2BLK7_9STRA|mmetsp:Transcript_17987/g.37635  ORF Transcript_17987/g.37635 Transcript_17987/m.37635 type:complete len:121 (+) Transcript_17987:125-487(+)|eukprot:CAMPEP_0182533564 /NCGR_PEP_ID=MMETSP1323-20130603/13878_1 /TAXON_ID=236787 /ORGANISM="Florenciella parvula, Strain RCC1693" /LENGTH=120 /DNA_ID=CAMNT_0024743465 /DNA_START=109 /DNA_END=471 /DNA_ORIENTATION=+